MASDFSGRVCLVTGGSSGIGLATARAFADRGASVVIAARREEAGREAVSAIRSAGGAASFLPVDVARAEEVQALVEKTIETHGRLDYACNSAGVAPEPKPTSELGESEWDRVVETNLKGTWLSMKYQVPPMLERERGAIVNVASVYGLVGSPYGLGAYTASKHGVVGLTRSVALELAGKNVRVNAVCPAFIRTPMLLPVTGGTPEGEEFWGKQHPLGRIGDPEEVAQAVLWLCSDEASFVTGQSLPIDGGWIAQ